MDETQHGIAKFGDLRASQLRRRLDILASLSFNRAATVSPGIVDIARTGGLRALLNVVEKLEESGSIVLAWLGNLPDEVGVNSDTATG